MSRYNCKHCKHLHKQTCNLTLEKCVDDDVEPCVDYEKLNKKEDKKC